MFTNSSYNIGKINIKCIHILPIIKFPFFRKVAEIYTFLIACSYNFVIDICNILYKENVVLEIASKYVHYHVNA